MAGMPRYLLGQILKSYQKNLDWNTLQICPGLSFALKQLHIAASKSTSSFIDFRKNKAIVSKEQMDTLGLCLATAILFICPVISAFFGSVEPWAQNINRKGDRVPPCLNSLAGLKASNTTPLTFKAYKTEETQFIRKWNCAALIAVENWIPDW